VLVSVCVTVCTRSTSVLYQLPATLKHVSAHQRTSVCRIAFFILLAVALTWGQSSHPPSNASPDVPSPIKLGSITVSGELRGRGQYWNWFLDNSRTHYAFGQSLLRLAVSQQRSKFGWKIGIAQPALYSLPQNAFQPGTNFPLGLGGVYYAANGRRNAASLFVSEAYLAIRGIDRNHSTLKLGRFEFAEGEEKPANREDLAWIQHRRVAERLIGRSDWTGITRSFDGAHFSSDIGSSTNITAVAGRATQGVFQVNGMGEMNVNVLYAAYSREISTKKTDSLFRLFALGYQDGREVVKEDNRPLSVRAADRANIRITTFGVNYAVVAPIRFTGKWDLLVWGAQQIGHWGVLRHRANSGLFELGWRPPVPWVRPWLRAGAFFASGDGNPNDSKHATFIQPLPTQQMYARLPFYTLQNTEDYTGQVIIQPTHRLELRSEVHKVKIHSVNDRWYLGSGAFQNSSFGYYALPDNGHRGLANYVDFSMDYQVTERFGVSYYVGAMSGKGAETNSLKGKKGGFSYLEMSYRF